MTDLALMVRFSTMWQSRPRRIFGWSSRYSYCGCGVEMRGRSADLAPCVHPHVPQRRLPSLGQHNERVVKNSRFTKTKMSRYRFLWEYILPHNYSCQRLYVGKSLEARSSHNKSLSHRPLVLDPLFSRITPSLDAFDPDGSASALPMA